MIEADTSHQLAFGDTLKTIDIDIPSFPDRLPDGTDLNKLAKAVARHETGSCTVGNSALVHNNAFGIRECGGGRCYGFKTYSSCEESAEDFKRLWRDYYGKFPDRRLASRYSGNDRSENWLANVTAFYNSY